MRIVICISLVALILAGCDDRYSRAKTIVQHELGLFDPPAFNGMKAKNDGQIVCGYVRDTSGTARFFVAYVDLGQAVVEPAGGFSPAAEMGNPLLAGDAKRFRSSCG